MVVQPLVSPNLWLLINTSTRVWCGVTTAGSVTGLDGCDTTGDG